jgi:hypothetical protein
VAQASAPTRSAIPTQDIGTTDLYWGTFGQGLLTDWWETTSDLIWPQSVITYGRMRHDPQIRAVLQGYTLPIMRATWAIDPTGCRDEVAQHCADDLGLPIVGIDPTAGPARRRGVQWYRHLKQSLFQLVYGHMPFEFRYRIESSKPGGCHLDNLGARMPWTLAQIRLNQDSTIEEVVQTTQFEPLPANRLLWYVQNQEGSNWAGISMLRAAFGAWLLKHETWRVHATSIRRFGMGVPQVTAPQGATAGQVSQAQALASAMRVGDQTGVGLPQGFNFNLAGLTGSVPDALQFIEYLDTCIARMAMSTWMQLGQTQTGSRALGETFLDMFLLSLQGVADEIALTATSGQMGMPGIITDLVDNNWGKDEPAPRIVCTDVGENYEVTAESLEFLTRYGALSPDPGLDDWIRKTWRLPARTGPWQPTSRGIPAAGQPGGAFLPLGATPTPAVQGSLDLPPQDGVDDIVPEARVPSWTPPPPPAPPKPAPAPAATPPATPPPVAAGGAPSLGPLRRLPTKVEAAAGFDAMAIHDEWTVAVGGVLASYRQVVSDQKVQVVDQVIAQVKAGKVGKMAALAVDTSAGADLLANAMADLADTAARRMIEEAASQGVTIPESKVRIDGRRLTQLAQARAGLAGQSLAAAAGAYVLQVAAAAEPIRTPEQVGNLAASFVDGLSDVSLRDQLGAAMTAAQNIGRVAVLEAAPESAPPVTYTASEIEDKNTCQACQDIDTTEFIDLPDAESSYPNGGFLECSGGLRCRGTVVAVWGAPSDIGPAGDSGA